ncbi:MAG: hypothetical protein WCC52_09225 [Nitrosotalea sp.]
MKHERILFFILEKMYRNRVVGARHISLEDLRTGCPSHERGNIEKGLKKLVKENLVLQHPTSYGMQYALNPQRLQDVMKILDIRV